MRKTSFEFVLSAVPYQITVEPYTFNETPRFRVHYNNGPEYNFVWDASSSQFRAIDDETSVIPVDLELAISSKLLEMIPNNVS